MVGQQNADIADTLQLRDVAMANIFDNLYSPIVGSSRRNTDAV